MSQAERKYDIASMTLAELSEYITALGEPKYRASQIFDWINKGENFHGMRNVPAALKEKLVSDGAFIAGMKLERKQVSADGTVKYLFSADDGEMIEAVLMSYKHGNTLCISSEAGCAMGCSFCASTLGGLSRRLLPSEMLMQVIMAQRDAGERISNVVLMGIGEPLDNYENVMKFLRLVGSPDSLNIGYRHISLSTCGLVDKIDRLADEALPITLSVSLHAYDDETRSALMPINKKWCISELLSACARYFAKTGRRISFEYTLIAGKNDSEGGAKKLARVLKNYCGNMPLHVNLIPVNNVTERGLRPSSREGAERFAAVLEGEHITATIRRKLGSDIDASCGQLRAKAAKK